MPSTELGTKCKQQIVLAHHLAYILFHGWFTLLILFRGILLRLLGFVRFMLSAKTEPECFPGLITVLNGVCSLLCSKSDNL